MTVIIIDEENHGTIGVAENMKAALQYLINTNWLTFGYEFWDGKKECWTTIGKIFDDIGWNKTNESLLEWALNHDPDSESWYVWEGSFYFDKRTVYEED